MREIRPASAPRVLAAPRPPRVAVAIGGLDPSGGAGLLADVRAFEAAGVHPLCVCTTITVQSSSGLRASHAVSPARVIAQLDELERDTRIAAAKVGATGSAANARALAEWLGARPRLLVIVDPVMRASRIARGADALRPRLDRVQGEDHVRTRSAERAAWSLARAAALVTPNRAEAEAWLGREIRGDDDAREAARELVRRGLRAVLLKGGHGSGASVVDWLAMPSSVTRIAHPRVTIPGATSAHARTRGAHGSGCTLASLIAGRLANRARARVDGGAIEDAARWAIKKMERALERARQVGKGMPVLDPRE